MPTINRPRKKAKPVSERKKIRLKYYNTKSWKETREYYKSLHPLCERCLEKGKIKEAEAIHHKFSPFAEGLTEAERMELLLDVDNLEALCNKCHAEEHNLIKHNKNI